ncbi:hypothetical protein ASE14_12005 [Agromyces sp. Root81]|uniref:DUF1801 domain-containing protein n=1 Tax=Agromyces sp. Root81 TaxID=1736601 RepID=UPI0006FCCEE1|nr:DUF1801 domain-containing protein [Agromyces sp. Root81]KRC61563.1 hypothetical protein ASE14_12005 [Agromyces sp. Root81]
MTGASNMIAASPEVDRYLDGLASEQADLLSRLRDGIRGVAPAGAVESIKWNGPNYAIDGTDRVTVGVDPRGKVRIVMHRGVKIVDADGFSFDDDTGLVRWAAVDRGVIALDPVEIDEHLDEIVALIARWLRL